MEKIIESVLRRVNIIRVFIARLKNAKRVDKYEEETEFRPSAFDVPDLRDYTARIPKKIELPLQTTNWKRSGRKATNQFQTMRCSAYGGEGAKGVSDSCEAQKPIYHDPLELWGHQLLEGASEKYGDYIQNMLKQLLRWGLYTDGKHYTITEFRKITSKDPEVLMRWLALGKMVVTGLWVREDEGYGTNYNRCRFDKDGILHISSGRKMGAHLQYISDYKTTENGVYFFFPNSYGEDWGDDGGCWVHESEIGNTMSKYVLFDTIDKVD